MLPAAARAGERSELELELRSARPPAHGPLRQRSAAGEESGGVGEIPFERGEAQRRMECSEFERRFEVRRDVDVSDEDLGQRAAAVGPADAFE